LAIWRWPKNWSWWIGAASPTGSANRRSSTTWHEGRGGTIYQWTLRFNSYPHQIALMKGHHAMFDFLYSESDRATQLLVNCALARREEAQTIANEHPEIVPELADVDRALVAKYCWETNTNYEAVKLMLDLGFPVAHPERSHGYTPLHNAAWAGSADLVELLISRGHPADIRDPVYHATSLDWALHDCLVEKRHPEGEFARVVKALLEAGSPLKDVKYPTGDAAVESLAALFDLWPARPLRRSLPTNSTTEVSFA
jgi:Ankyrin repeats (many copies)